MNEMLNNQRVDVCDITQYAVKYDMEFAREAAECSSFMSNRVLGIALGIIGIGALAVSLSAVLPFTASLIVGASALLTVIYGVYLFKVSYKNYRDAYPFYQATREILAGNYKRALEHLEYYIDTSHDPNSDQDCWFKFKLERFGPVDTEGTFTNTYFGMYCCCNLLILRDKEIHDEKFIEKFRAVKKIWEGSLRNHGRRNNYDQFNARLIREIECLIQT